MGTPRRGELKGTKGGPPAVAWGYKMKGLFWRERNREVKKLLIGANNETGRNVVQPHDESKLVNIPSVPGFSRWELSLCVGRLKLLH
jgi:hypothetical protein